MNAGSIAMENVSHNYGGIRALQDITADIRAGEFVAVLGPNGAGKTTFGMIACGMIRPTGGVVRIDGEPVRNRRHMIDKGVALVPAGRRLFGQLSIRENLLLGGVGAGCSSAEIRLRMDMAVKILPETLHGRLDRVAAMLSGGEQQLLAVARGVMVQPRLIFIDEPSMGLAPVMTDRVYGVLDELASTGVAVVLIEQVADRALDRANKLYVLNHGQIIYAGTSKDAAVVALHDTIAVGR